MSDVKGGWTQKVKSELVVTTDGKKEISKWLKQGYSLIKKGENLGLVSKELNHLAAILHVYARTLIFMK